MISDDFKVSIVRPDQSAYNEYQVLRERLKSGSLETSCWLESEHAALFQVLVERMNIHDSTEWTVTVKVDGRRIQYCTLPRYHSSLTTEYMYSQEQGRTMKGKLCFAALDTTDDDKLVTLRKKDLSDVGRIEVELHRGNIGRSAGQGTPFFVEEKLGVVNEKDKKHGGSIGSAWKTRVYESHQAVDFVYLDEYPRYRFIFNYRIEAVLQLLKIIPDRPLAHPLQVTPESSRKRPMEVIDLCDSSDDDERGMKPKGKHQRRLDCLCGNPGF